VRTTSAALLSLLIGATAAAAQDYERERGLREAIWADRWLEGLRLYDELARDGVAPSGQASYLAGWADWRLHRPEDARPQLEKAARAGFRAGGGRPQPGELLAKIAEYSAAKPPAIDVPGLDRSVIDAYADAKTPLTAPVLDALPRIAEIGREIFREPPPVRFFLFARIPALVRFYDATQLTSRKTGEVPHSTGGAGMVIYCEEKAHRATEAETVSIALHETVHAWIAGYLRARYDRDVRVPRYVDEGLAVYVASSWSDDLRALSARRVAAWRKNHAAPPPEFETLGSPRTFYDPKSVYLNYLLSDLLMQRLLGPPRDGAARIPALLDAFARTGDDAEAWREVTGKDVRAEYRALASELWR